MRTFTLRLSSVLIALFVGIVSSLALVSMTAAPANASTATPVVGMKLRGGPGHTSTVYAHIWQLDGKRGPCIDFGRRTPDSASGTRTIGQVPGMTAEQSRQAFKLVQTYRGTSSDFTAAALALSVWKLRGDADFKTWYSWAKRTDAVGPRLERRVNAMLAEAKSHGPYKVSVKLQPVLKGQTGVGTVKVTDSRGKAARSMPVNVKRTTTAAKLVRKAGRTNSKGVATFKFTRTGSGKVGFRATVSAPSVKKALLSQPSAGNQRLLVGGFRDSWSGSAEYTSSAGAPTFTTTCDTDCDGQATVGVKYCNPQRNASPMRWVGSVGGSKVLTLDVKPGTCSQESIRLTDGNVLTMKYCTLNKVGGSCTNRFTELKKTYEVVCPAWATATIQLACTCKPDESGSVTFDPLIAGNPRYYTGYVIIDDGTIVRPVPLEIGVSKTVDIGQIKSGTKIDVTFKVWRDANKTQLLGDHLLQSVTVN